MLRNTKVIEKKSDGSDFNIETLIQNANQVSRELSIASIYDAKANEIIESWKNLLKLCFDTYESRDVNITCNQKVLDEVSRWKELNNEVLRFEEEVNATRKLPKEPCRLFQHSQHKDNQAVENKPKPETNQESKPKPN